MHFDELFLAKYLKFFVIFSAVMVMLLPFNILSIRTLIGILYYLIGIAVIIILFTVLKYRNQVISFRIIKQKDYILIILSIALMIIVPLLYRLLIYK